MPNIEIYGYRWEAGIRTGVKVFELLQGMPCVEKAVVTIIESSVYDQIGRPQPYIRLMSSEEDHVAEIIERLEALNLDIEYVPINRFIPKKGRKNEHLP